MKRVLRVAGSNRGGDRWDKRFDNLITSYVIPELPIGEGTDRSNLRIVDQIVDDHATSVHVRFITSPSNPNERHLVRGFFRPYNPLRPGGRFARFAWAADIADLMREHGICTPRNEGRFQGVHWPTWTQYLLLVEEFIPGHEVSWKSKEEVIEAFRILARIHNIRSDKWARAGMTSTGQAGTFMDRYLQKHYSRRADHVKPLLGTEFANELWNLIMESGRKMEAELGPMPFSLIHGDFKGSNLLMADNGELVVIDFLHASYSLASLEFINALAHACNRNNFANDAAVAYFNELNPDLLPQFEHGWRAGILLQSLVRFRSKVTKKHKPPTPNIEHLRKVTRELGMGSPDSDWQEAVRMIQRFEAFFPGGFDRRRHAP